MIGKGKWIASQDTCFTFCANIIRRIIGILCKYVFKQFPSYNFSNLRLVIRYIKSLTLFFYFFSREVFWRIREVVLIFQRSQKSVQKIYPSISQSFKIFLVYFENYVMFSSQRFFKDSLKSQCPKEPFEIYFVMSHQELDSNMNQFWIIGFPSIFPVWKYFSQNEDISKLKLKLW